MSLRFALALLLVPALSACRRDPPPVDPGISGSSSSTSGAGGSAPAPSGPPRPDCLIPSPPRTTCSRPSDCVGAEVDTCSTPTCVDGHCVYPAREADGGVLTCDPGRPGRWTCEAPDATHLGGYCCPAATTLPSTGGL